MKTQTSDTNKNNILHRKHHCRRLRPVDNQVGDCLGGSAGF